MVGKILGRMRNVFPHSTLETETLLNTGMVNVNERCTKNLNGEKLSPHCAGDTPKTEPYDLYPQLVGYLSYLADKTPTRFGICN